MKKKFTIALGVMLVLLAFLSLYSLIAGIPAWKDALREATALGGSATDLYFDLIGDIVTIVILLGAAVWMFVTAFEDGESGYRVVEDDEEEGDEGEDEEDEEEHEEPEEQVARVEAERAEREAAARQPRAFREKKDEKKDRPERRESGADEREGRNGAPAAENASSVDPSGAPEEPCQQCKTCAMRLPVVDRCKAFAKKPGYVRNNRFACGYYREKK